MWCDSYGSYSQSAMPLRSRNHWWRHCALRRGSSRLLNFKRTLSKSQHSWPIFALIDLPRIQHMSYPHCRTCGRRRKGHPRTGCPMGPVSLVNRSASTPGRLSMTILRRSPRDHRSLSAPASPNLQLSVGSSVPAGLSLSVLAGSKMEVRNTKGINVCLHIETIEALNLASAILQQFVLAAGVGGVAMLWLATTLRYEMVRPGYLLSAPAHYSFLQLLCLSLVMLVVCYATDGEQEANGSST
jgi:hypothetical protein